MELDQNIVDLFTAIVTDIRDISNSVTGAANAKNATVQGNLTTTAKNLVGGINELKAALDGAVGSGVTSVNGQAGPGAVTIDSGMVTENGNLYHTDARVLASVLAGYAAAAGTVAATDSVIAAIQKIDGNVQAIDVTSVINDAAAGTTTTYSGTKIDSQIATAIAGALEGEDLSDLAASVAALAAADNSLLSFGAAQTLTPAQKTQAQTNLGLGDLENANFAAAYIAARDA